MKYRVTAEVDIEIEVNDQNAIDRCVNNEDGWRDSLYDLRTRDDVLQHWAWNACANGRHRVDGLDGWADMSPDAVRMNVIEVDIVYVVEAKS